MTITATQVREARIALGWTSLTLAKLAQITLDEVTKAQDDVGIRHLGGLQLQAICRAFDRAGIEFLSAGDEGPCVALQRAFL